MAQKKTAAFVAAVMLGSIWACAPRDDSGANTTDDSLAIDSARGSVAEDTNWMSTSLASDGGIMGALKEVNRAEIEASELAVERASQTDVKNFAQRMITDHQKLMKRGDSVAQSLNINVADAPDNLENMHRKTLDALKAIDDTGGMNRGMPNTAGTRPGANNPPNPPNTTSPNRTQSSVQASGQNFDRAYMDAMVMDHEKALSFIDSAMARATNSQLSAILQKEVRPAVEQHLTKAREVQRKVGTARMGSDTGKSAPNPSRPRGGGGAKIN